MMWRSVPPPCHLLSQRKRDTGFFLTPKPTNDIVYYVALLFQMKYNNKPKNPLSRVPNISV